MIPTARAPFTWRSESDEPAPTAFTEIDDNLPADRALEKVRKGEVLLHTGDFHNAKQLLAAMARRLHHRNKPKTALEAFRLERQDRQREHQTLGRVVVALDANYKLKLKRAPDVWKACEQVWGPPPEGETIVPLKALFGMISAAQWRKTGLMVPGLHGLIVPHYGVYTPTRTDYVEAVRGIKDIKGVKVFDIGTGTGVLSFVLLQKGAASAVATDVDSRAIACANENAKTLGYDKSFTAVETDLFPEGKADLIISNPPWIPEPPKNRVDRAVFDDKNDFLIRFLAGIRGHLNPGGRAALLISNLAELLGLREDGWLMAQLEREGLKIVEQVNVKARHGKAKDPSDPLYQARTRELTSLYLLSPG